MKEGILPFWILCRRVLGQRWEQTWTGIWSKWPSTKIFKKLYQHFSTTLIESPPGSSGPRMRAGTRCSPPCMWCAGGAWRQRPAWSSMRAAAPHRARGTPGCGGRGRWSCRRLRGRLWSWNHLCWKRRGKFEMKKPAMLSINKFSVCKKKSIDDCDK